MLIAQRGSHDDEPYFNLWRNCVVGLHVMAVTAVGVEWTMSVTTF